MSSLLIFPSMSAYSSQIDNHCGAAAARGARQSAGRAAEGRLQTAYAIASDLNKGRYADCVRQSEDEEATGSVWSSAHRVIHPA